MKENLTAGLMLIGVHNHFEMVKGQIKRLNVIIIMGVWAIEAPIKDKGVNFQRYEDYKAPIWKTIAVECHLRLFPTKG
jgi:hypothetical protein